MLRQRVIYSVVVSVTIAIGLLVRLKKSWFPDVVNLYLGDILYAFMIFYIISFIVPLQPHHKRFLITILVCYCIELGQLYNAAWINDIRGTLPGRLILGSGFLLSDLMAYFIGAVSAFFVGKFVQIRDKRE